jgi:peptidoglycan/LPS O-acetylase OafA/YrhL
MAWLAAISYSLYLSHKLAFHAVQVVADGRLDGMGLLAFGCHVTFAVLVGATLYYGVERPFLQLRDRRAGARPAPSAAIAAEN